MNTFIKLNVISMLYAVILFIPIELYVNISRINRLTGWGFNKTYAVLGISAVVSAIILAVFIVYLTKKWMNERVATFWATLLWFPYLILFTFIFASLFPITNPADQGGPGDGFIILGLLILYPFVVLLINTFSFSGKPIES